jgi:hypothetical protein
MSQISRNIEAKATTLGRCGFLLTFESRYGRKFYHPTFVMLTRS